jgi:hypothetical protein
MTAQGEHGRHLIEGAIGSLRWHLGRVYDFGRDGAKCFARRAGIEELVAEPAAMPAWLLPVSGPSRDCGSRSSEVS